MKTATYRVFFIDARDNMFNCKLLEAESTKNIYEYMEKEGHEVVSITPYDET